MTDAHSRLRESHSRKRESRPRVLYVSTVDRVLRQMLPHMDAARAAGFAVEAACQFTRFEEEVRPHVDAVHTVPLRRFPLHPINLVGLFRLLRLLRARRYVLVHAHNPTGGFVGRLAATLAGVPVRLYTVHGFHFHRQGGRVGNAVYRAIERFAGHLLSDGVMVINGEDYEAALRYHIVPEDRLFRTNGVGISTEDFDPARIAPAERRAVHAEVGIPEGVFPVLASVGEMTPNKRIADAIAAFAEIRKSFPDAHLLLLGDGPLEEEMKALARRLGVWDRCRFLGWRRDVARLLSVTDLLLFPSAREGLPCSIQEALCMHTLVAASDIRGNRDLAIPASGGRIVPLGDAAALAQAAVVLLSLPPAERRRLNAEGRARMECEYGRGPCVARWLEIYDTLLRRHSPLTPRPPLPQRGEGEAEVLSASREAPDGSSTDSPSPLCGRGGRGVRGEPGMRA